MDITDKNQCTGCSACYNICPTKSISMWENQEGFLYPVIDAENCIGCNKCRKICPVNRRYFEENRTFPKSFLAKSNSRDIRISSTSGGVFTSIAIEFIEKYNGVVFGANYDDNFEVFHDYAETIDKVHQFSKSKYVQSKIGTSFKIAESFLKVGRYVLFSGTPCQIYGLKSFLGHEYDNLFCVDVVCHGVPSPKLHRKYLLWHSKHHGKIAKIIIRDKKIYKNFYRSGYRVLFKNGYSYFTLSDKDIMGKFFWGEISSRLSCYNCNFKSIWRESDLTLGDCWFSEELAGIKDPDGITLVIVQSDKGMKILEDIKNINMWEVDSETAIKANGGMIYSSAKPHISRSAFFKELDKTDASDLDILAKKYIKSNSSIFARLTSVMKNFNLIPACMIVKKNQIRFVGRKKRIIPDDARGKIKLE